MFAKQKMIIFPRFFCKVYSPSYHTLRYWSIDLDNTLLYSCTDFLIQEKKNSAEISIYS